MIPKSFGLLFYLKKPRGYVKGERPIYLRITMDGVMKEMSIHRNCDPGRWDSRIGRAIISKTSGRRSASEPLTTDDPFRALNAYLDTLQAKVHEARHQLLMSGKPITAEAVRDFARGRKSGGERPHLLLEIFQYHNDQAKALVGKKFSKGTLTKFNTVLKHPHLSAMEVQIR